MSDLGPHDGTARLAFLRCENVARESFEPLWVCDAIPTSIVLISATVALFLIVAASRVLIRNEKRRQGL